MLGYLSWAAAQLLFQVALNKVVEGGASEFGKNLVNNIPEQFKEKIQKLGETIWNRLTNKPEVAALEQADSQVVAVLEGEMGQVLQNEEIKQQVEGLAKEIQQAIANSVQAKNVQQIFGGQGLQINEKQDQPIIQIQGNPTLNFGTGKQQQINVSQSGENNTQTNTFN